MGIFGFQKPIVDVHLLPIKLHYFILYGAFGCVMPYMPIVARGLNIEATAVGIIFMIIPFFILLGKPIFGAITDHFQNIKLVTALLAVATCLSYLSIIFIPRIDFSQNQLPISIHQCSLPSYNSSNKEHRLSCHDSLEKDETWLKVPNISCLLVFHNNTKIILHEKSGTLSTLCETILFNSIHDIQPNHLNDCLDFNVSFTISTIDKHSETKNKSVNDVFQLSEVNTSGTILPIIVPRIKFYGTPSKYGIDKNFNIDSLNVNNSNICQVNILSSISEDSLSPVCSCMESFDYICVHETEFCLTKKTKEVKFVVYKTYQFWIFTVLAVIAQTCSSTMFSLSDAACYLYLGDKSELFGHQRLWATISWGVFSFVTGYLNDLASAGSFYKDFSPGFYLMACLIVLDLLVLWKIKFPKIEYSSSICKDVARIFSSLEIATFATGVFVVGGLSGLLWSYQFWYLEDLGANQLLLGLTIAVQCLAAEVPFFIISGWIIKHFGHFYCLIGAFVAYALRYVLYYFLINPWLVLPIEVLHGITFGVFYAAMTSYANTNAPPGTETTMQGVLGGIFEGLGVAIGSLLSGISFDKLSGRDTFLIAAVISFFCSLSYFSIYFIFKKSARYKFESSIVEKSRKQYYNSVKE